jgi:hypothetical protein
MQIIALPVVTIHCWVVLGWVVGIRWIQQVPLMRRVHGGAMLEPRVHALKHSFIERSWEVPLLPLLNAKIKVLSAIHSCAPMEISNLLEICQEHLPFILTCNGISVTLANLTCIELGGQL